MFSLTAAGRSAFNEASDDLVGASGTTTTRLAPAGKARIGDVIRDVVSDGILIEPGTAVEVVEVRDGRISVRPMASA